MPVVGHAFAGVATAIQFEPAADASAGERRTQRTLTWWTPFVVAAAYLPDIVTQLLSIPGVPRATLIGHSLVAGAAASVALGAGFSAYTGVTATRSIVVAAGSVALHDVLDILQANDRAPFWPWSVRTINASTFGLPAGTAAEGFICGLLFAVYAAWRLGSRRTLGRSLGAAGRTGRARALTAAAVVAIVAAAVVTHGLRGTRERELAAARYFLDTGRPAEALKAADRADGWPRATRPGRIDMVRGEAYEAMGQPALAEAHYLRAYDEDPTNFWALADLAEYYAASDRPAAERRRLVQTYVDQLRDRFGHHRALPGVLAGIERRLRRADAADSRADPALPAGRRTNAG